MTTALLRGCLLVWLSLGVSCAANAQVTQCRTDPIGSISSNCASEKFVTDSITALNYGAVLASTPTVSAATGTFTTATAALRYQIRGKQTWFNLTITITTNGSAAGNVQVTGLPFTFNSGCTPAGRATLVSGKMLQGLGQAAGSSLVIWNYDNTYPGATGEQLVMNGVCETT